MLCQYCSAKLTSLPLLHGHSQNINGAAPAAVMGLEQAYMLQGPHALWPRTCQVAALCCCAHLQPRRSLAPCFYQHTRPAEPAWPCDTSWQRCCNGTAHTHICTHAYVCTHARPHKPLCPHTQTSTHVYRCMPKGAVATGSSLHLKVCQIKAILHGFRAQLWYDSSHTSQL